jgi:acetyl/propionyl-CoA carboxylase alpha subunit
MPTRPFAIRLGDRVVTVAIDGDSAIVAGDPVLVTEVGPGEWQVTANGRSHRVYAAGPREAPWIWHDGVAYRPDVVDPRRTMRARRRDVSGDLAAPMPATVRAIHVEPGDAVTRGQTLVVLEAMKMELPLRAPADGTVTSVACRVGDLVQPGVPLVAIE